MQYIRPFKALIREATTSTVRGKLHLSMAYDDFINMLKAIASTVDVDEPWYLAQYGDIASAVRAGTVRSARQHFIEDGYFEGRLPFPIVVDETWYFEHNPDVAKDVREGRVVSAQVHFDSNGYHEGRHPFQL